MHQVVLDEIKAVVGIVPRQKVDLPEGAPREKQVDQCGEEHAADQIRPLDAEEQPQAASPVQLAALDDLTGDLIVGGGNQHGVDAGDLPDQQQDQHPQALPRDQCPPEHRHGGGGEHQRRQQRQLYGKAPGTQRQRDPHAQQQRSADAAKQIDSRVPRTHRKGVVAAQRRQSTAAGEGIKQHHEEWCCVKQRRSCAAGEQIGERFLEMISLHSGLLSNLREIQRHPVLDALRGLLHRALAVKTGGSLL